LTDGAATARTHHAATVVAVCALAIIMLIYAVTSRAPSAYYHVLKVVIVLASALVGVRVWRAGWLGPALGIVLVALGLVHLTARMRRAEWAQVDVATAIVFGVAAILVLGERSKAG